MADGTGHILCGQKHVHTLLTGHTTGMEQGLMAHIIINPSLSAAIGYNLFLNPPKFAEVSAILEPANSM